jgi:hypothetical protein
MNKSTRMLNSLTKSRCCGVDALLVKSRDGGFITKNCTSCEKPDTVRPNEIPDQNCDRCKGGPDGLIGVIEKYDGYYYRCERCRDECKISDILPHWSTKFRYWGLAAPGDESYRG